MSDAEQMEALMKLRVENEEMEAAIMTLTQGNAEEETKVFVQAPTKGIIVKDYGTRGKPNDEAGKDLGSSWCPPQCSRRTVLGGFFTS